MRVFAVLGLATALLAPLAMAQKPGGPPPPRPPSTPANGPVNPNPASPDSVQAGEERVLFLQGRIATSDGTPVPSDLKVERLCNNRVRQQVYATSHGDFSMQLGSRADSFVDASGDSGSQSSATNKDSLMGVPKHELRNCELQASASGFRSDVISLVEIDSYSGGMDVGVMVLQRTAKADGLTLSAAPYRAPKEARKAYEKGLDAENKSNLASARKYFETAVKIYPKYTSAWFQLGTVLQNADQKDAARRAYTQAATIDSKFLAPYLSLALLATEAENWTEVLKFTGHILDLDPLKQAGVTGYLLDLDPSNYTEAYFYNALANYKLNRLEDAEKSGLKAEKVDLPARFPQVHLMLGEIFGAKKDYAAAIAEFQTFLALVPHAPNTAQVRERLAKWERLNSSVPAKEKPDHL